MDLFKDKKYDSFDELTQLIEPFIFPVNDAISQLPDSFPVTLADLTAMKNGRSVVSGYISLMDAVGYFFKKSNIKVDMSELHQHLREFYAFEYSQDAMIDMSTITMYGEVRLTKKRALYSDDEILSLMLRTVENNVTNYIGKASDVPASRFYELAESFGFLDQMKKCTTFKERKSLLKKKMVDSIKDNEIRIRDYNLAIRFSTWIQKWLADGNLAALKNIAMLKVVSYEGKAIYSINEEKL